MLQLQILDPVIFFQYSHQQLHYVHETAGYVVKIHGLKQQSMNDVSTNYCGMYSGSQVLNAFHCMWTAVEVPGLFAFQVKCFLYPSSPGETSLWLKGLSG